MINVPLILFTVTDESDLDAIPNITEHLEEDLTWLLIYRCEGQWCQEFFGGHPWQSIKETVIARTVLADAPLTLIITSALLIDVESFSRTDWANGIDLNVIDEVAEDDGDLADDNTDLGAWFPPSGEV